MLTTISAPLPKPKPVKGARKKKKRSKKPYCTCKYVNVNHENYSVCSKCKRPVMGEKLRKVLETVADIVVKKIILLRDKFCVCSAPRNGHSDVMQAGHLVTRGKESVKWDLRNVNVQCASCNLLHEHRPERYTAWFLLNFESEGYVKLVADSEEITKLSVEQLTELCTQLTAIHSRQLEDKKFVPRFSQKEILSGEWRTK